MATIHVYDRPIFTRLPDGMKAIPGVTIYGITDQARFDQRVPTIAFRLEGYSPREVAEQLGRAGMFVWAAICVWPPLQGTPTVRASGSLVVADTGLSACLEIAGVDCTLLDTAYHTHPVLSLCWPHAVCCFCCCRTTSQPPPSRPRPARASITASLLLALPPGSSAATVKSTTSSYMPASVVWKPSLDC